MAKEYIASVSDLTPLCTLRPRLPCASAWHALDGIECVIRRHGKKIDLVMNTEISKSSLLEGGHTRSGTLEGHKKSICLKETYFFNSTEDYADGLLIISRAVQWLRYQNHPKSWVNAMKVALVIWCRRCHAHLYRRIRRCIRWCSSTVLAVQLSAGIRMRYLIYRSRGETLLVNWLVHGGCYDA
jgi:hypothetical protein